VTPGERGRWTPVIAEARRRFGHCTFTNADLAEVIREFVSPMEAVRAVDKWRVSRVDGRYETRRKDDATVGLRFMARTLTSNYRKGMNPPIEQVERGVYRFVDRDGQ
jgi:hypothetical protein